MTYFTEAQDWLDRSGPDHDRNKLICAAYAFSLGAAHLTAETHRMPLSKMIDYQCLTADQLILGYDIYTALANATWRLIGEASHPLSIQALIRELQQHIRDTHRLTFGKTIREWPFDFSEDALSGMERQYCKPPEIINIEFSRLKI